MNNPFIDFLMYNMGFTVFAGIILAGIVGVSIALIVASIRDKRKNVTEKDNVGKDK